MDLYVLERALLSSHPNTEPLVNFGIFSYRPQLTHLRLQFRAIIEAYKAECKQSKQVIAHLSEGWLDICQQNET